MNLQQQIDRAGAAIALRGNGRREHRGVCSDVVRWFWDLLGRFAAGDFHVRIGSRRAVIVIVFFDSQFCSAANFVTKCAGFASHVWLQLGRGCVLRGSAQALIFCHEPMDFVIRSRWILLSETGPNSESVSDPRSEGGN